MLQRLATGTALIVGLVCTAAYPLGLGEIQVGSGLNQALAATIPLSSLSQDEAEDLRVQLASPADFEKAGLERVDYLSSLKFSVVGSKVRISSDEIAREPFLALLVEARAGNSRVLRGYTVLLDLPSNLPTDAGAGAAAPDRRDQAASTGSVARSEAPSIDAMPARSADAAVATGTQQAPLHRYGPIRSGQTFWSVASKLRPDPSLVSMDQTMLALYTANPQAFFGGINGLLTGSVLDVPSVDAMRAVPEIEARRRVQALRASSAAAGSGAAAAPPARPAAVVQSAVAIEAAAVIAAETPLTPEPVVDAAAAPATATADNEVAAPAPVDAGALAAATPTADAAAAVDATPVEVPAPAAAPAPAKPAEATPAPVAPPESYPRRWALALAVLALLTLLVLWRRRRQPSAVSSYGAAPAVAAPPAAATPVVKPEAAVAVAVMAPATAEPVVAASAELPFENAAATVETPGVVEPIEELPLLATQAPAEPESIDGEAGVPGDIDLATSTTGGEPSLDQLDPLAEADFHLSYGLYDEAVRGLIEAIAAEPERNDLQLKLAETYFAAGRAEDFEALALSIQPRLSPPEWGRLMFMGGQLCPDSALFRTEADADPIQAGHRGNGVEFALEPMLELPQPPAAPAARNDNLLEFELSQFDATAPVDVSTWHTQTQWRSPSTPGADAAPAALDLSDPGVVAFDELPKIDPADIDLYETEPEVEISTDDEVGTKLDLARAYLDMGDKQMARDLLGEVALQGNAAQKADAQTLLKRLPL